MGSAREENSPGAATRAAACILPSCGRLPVRPGRPPSAAGRPPGAAGRARPQEARAPGGPRGWPEAAGAAPTRPQVRKAHGRAGGVAPRGRGAAAGPCAGQPPARARGGRRPVRRAGRRAAGRDGLGPSTNPKGAHINSEICDGLLAVAPEPFVHVHGLALITVRTALAACLSRGSHDEGTICATRAHLRCAGTEIASIFYLAFCVYAGYKGNPNEWRICQWKLFSAMEAPFTTGELMLAPRLPPSVEGRFFRSAAAASVSTPLPRRSSGT